MPSQLIPIEGLLRKMKQLDSRIAENKQQIKKDRAHKTRLNKIIALVEQDQPPSNVTSIKQPMWKCPDCGDTVKARGRGAHVTMKHKGEATRRNKAAQVSRKRAAR